MTPRTDLQAEGDRDLCLLARAAGHVSEAEMAVIKDITVRVEVDLELVSCVLDSTSSGCGS